MAERYEEFLRPDGIWTRNKTRDAIRVRPSDVVAAVKKVPTAIDVQYYVGTAKHESNFAINERDTEPNGFQSWGIFQVSSEEAARAGVLRISDCLKLEPSVKVMVYLAEGIRKTIRKFLKLAADAPDPEGIEPYIAIGHNQGIGQIGGKGLLGTLSRHGLDWPGYVKRNPTINIVSHRYGNNVLPLHSPLRLKEKK